MTRLRAHIESAKQAYASLRYPGDLSAEVLETRAGMGFHWFTGVGLSAGALAAVLALVVVLSRQVDMPRPGSMPGQIDLVASGPTDAGGRTVQGVMVDPALSDRATSAELPY